VLIFLDSTRERNKGIITAAQWPVGMCIQGTKVPFKTSPISGSTITKLTKKHIDIKESLQFSDSEVVNQEKN
jgi:hypothetical protein